MKILSFLSLTVTGSVIVALYVVAPLAATLRPEFGGILLPVTGAFGAAAVFAGAIVWILRRVAPPATGPAELLAISPSPALRASHLRETEPAPARSHGTVPGVTMPGATVAVGRAL